MSQPAINWEFCTRLATVINAAFEAEDRHTAEDRQQISDLLVVWTGDIRSILDYLRDESYDIIGRLPKMHQIALLGGGPGPGYHGEARKWRCAAEELGIVAGMLDLENSRARKRRKKTGRPAISKTEAKMRFKLFDEYTERKRDNNSTYAEVAIDHNDMEASKLENDCRWCKRHPERRPK